MNLGQLYSFVVKAGMDADPRPRAKVSGDLRRAKRAYSSLRGGKKRSFDKERFKNPYADTRILYGNLDTEIGSIMVGIDMGGEELLLADRLNQAGKSIDLVMAHHPQGPALARLPQVMEMQSQILEKQGIPIDIATKMCDERIQEVERSLQSKNYSRYVDIAKLLDIPFMCCHTVADNHVASYLQRLFDRTKPKRIKDVVAKLNKIPEYADADTSDVGPKIVVGKQEALAGKIFVDMTGGTEGSRKVFARLSQAGVKTMICMHLSEAHIKVAKSEYMNVVVASHIASDTVGLNLLLDKLGKQTDIEIISCSGFRRVRR